MHNCKIMYVHSYILLNRNLHCFILCGIKSHVCTSSKTACDLMPQRMKQWRLRLLHIWLVWSTMPRWMKRQRLLIINLARGPACITESVLI